MGISFSVSVDQHSLRSLTSLRASATVNSVRVVEIIASRDAFFDYNAITRNTRIDVFYAHDRGDNNKLFDDSWWVRSKELNLETNQAMITAYSSLVYLQGRDVAAKPGSPEAVKSGMSAEELLLTFVAEQAGHLANSTRQSRVGVRFISSYGPMMSRDVPRRNLLAVLKSISADSIIQGQPVYFDVVAEGESYYFTVFRGQRGTDRVNTSSPFSDERETLRNIRIRDDWSSEANAIFAVGQGRGDNQLAVEVVNAAAIASDPIRRSEKTIQVSQTNDVAVLAAEARNALWLNRAKRTITGMLIDTPRSRFGIDWDFGDRLPILVGGISAEVVIDSMEIAVSERETTISAQFRTETSLD